MALKGDIISSFPWKAHYLGQTTQKLKAAHPVNYFPRFCAKILKIAPPPVNYSYLPPWKFGPNLGCRTENSLTLNSRAFWTHLTAGGGFCPPKISETDWRNIKCVVLLYSYDPPESIGTKKVQVYLVWRHSGIIRDVMSKTRKSPKIAKIMVFRYFFKQKLHFFGNDVCQSMLTHVLTPNKSNK